MKFSVIMPSYLGDFKGAANYRVEKFYRAIDSLNNQTFKDYELIIVSDGCNLTNTLCKPLTYPSVRVISIAKQPTFSGVPRNQGIEAALGEFILYLDTDDYLDNTHLESISSALGNYDWVYFDDYILLNKKWVRRKCDVNIRFRHGTSNICHKRSMRARWGGGYEHDFVFIQSLKKESSSFSKVEAGSYYVCHIPNRYDY